MLERFHRCLAAASVCMVLSVVGRSLVPGARTRSPFATRRAKLRVLPECGSSQLFDAQTIAFLLCLSWPDFHKGDCLGVGFTAGRL